MGLSLFLARWGRSLIGSSVKVLPCYLVLLAKIALLEFFKVNFGTMRVTVEIDSFKKYMLLWEHAAYYLFKFFCAFLRIISADCGNKCLRNADENAC